MDRRRNASPGRFGTHPVHVSHMAGVDPLTVNDTTILWVPTPKGKFVFTGFAAQCDTPGADSDGTILATVRKYDASGDAHVTLSAAIDLEAVTTKERAVAGVASAATEAQLLLDDGDVLNIAVVSNSAAIDTQPTLLSFTVELLQLN